MRDSCADNQWRAWPGPILRLVIKDGAKVAQSSCLPQGDDVGLGLRGNGPSREEGVARGGCR